MLTHQNVPSPTSSVQYATTLRNLYREASLMSRLRHPNGAWEGCGHLRSAAQRRRGFGVGAGSADSSGLLSAVLARPGRSLCKSADAPGPLSSPAVCQYLGACVDPPCLLMELCGRKSVDVVSPRAEALAGMPQPPTSEL